MVNDIQQFRRSHTKCTCYIAIRKMDLNILFIFALELLEKLEDTHLRAHIISMFVAIDDSTTTSRVD